MPRRPLASPSTASHVAAPPAVAGYRPLVLAIALAACFAPPAAHAQPTGAQAIVGAASLSQQGNHLVVTTQNGTGGFSSINWQSFSVPAGTTTWFAQPGVTSTSINRVVGSDPSAIFGTLGSNGRLVLVNPAGITVGAGAVVDTAGFTASTLRMSDADALAGRMRFDGSAGGVLQVDGQVLARSGDVVLIGSQVQTGATALVQSPEGTTVLAAGQKVEVTGRGLEGIVFQLQAPTDQAVNLGTLKGDAVGVFAGTLRHSGLVQAQAASLEGGRVVLKASDQALVAGTVQAQGVGGAGGSVDVLGAKVGLLGGASIDTSNTGSGGRIRVGGDYQGSNAQVPNAQVTFVDASAQLKANATGQGNGGKVIVWADDTTRMHGSIEAKAGALGGDGGFVETSGKRFLDATGARVAATAPQGKAGTWLLDPDDLTIMANPGPSPAPGQSENYGGAVPDFTPASSGTASVIYDSTLNAALNTGGGTDVTVTTGPTWATFGGQSGDIVLLGGVDLHLDQPNSAKLTLNAYNDIRFSGGTTTFRTTPAPTPAPASAPAQLKVVLNPGLGSVVIEANAGLQATAGDPASGVTVQVRDGKEIANDGSLRLDTGTSLVSSNVVVKGGGTIDISGTVSGASIDMAANAVNLNGATVTATAGSLHITSNGPADIYASSLSATGGDLTVSGGSMFTSPERSGLSVSDATFSTTGKLLLDGGTSDPWAAGLRLDGSVQIDAAGGSTLQGSNFNAADTAYGDGVDIGTTMLSGSGALTVVGRASAWGTAVSVSGATVSRSGDISMRSAATGSGAGIEISSSTVASNGGLITLGTDRSIDGSYSTLDSSGGAIAIGGGSDTHSGVGVSLTGSSVHAATGKVTITGRSADDIGFLFRTSAPALTVAGSDVLITGSSLAGGTAIRIDGESITSTNSMRLNAVGGGIEIVNGSTLTNSGTGPMVLDATPGTGTGYLGIHADATSTLSTSSLRASGDDVLLQNVDLGGTGGVVSGRSANGGFTVQNVGTGPMQVGSVDGVAGIAATGGTVLLATPGQLRLSEVVQSDVGPAPSPTPSPSNPNAAITLVANDLVTDGNGQLLAPNDRWAVWLNAPTPGLAGSPVSGNDALWGRTFGADALPETGNRYLFQYRPTVSVGVASVTRTYDATADFALSATATGLVDASQYGNVFNQDLVLASMSVNSPSKDVGSYTINLDSYALPGGYIDGGVSAARGTATITPATVTLAGLDASKVYDGSTAATPVGTAALSGVFAGDVVGVSGGQPGGTFTDRNVGTGKLVTVTGLGLSGTDNKNYVLDPTITADITPAFLTVGGLAASSKVYDATTAARLNGTAALSGVLGNDVVAVSGTAVGAFADKNVGMSKAVTVSGLGLSGADAGNYRIVPASLAADITPATLKVGGLAAADKVYDATTSATLTGTAGVVGLLGTDSVTLVGAPTATFADKDVGSGKAVSVALAGTALAGADAGNYVLATPAGLTASITPAPLVITATDQSKLQGSGFSFTGAEFRASGLVGGETVAAVSLTSTGSAADAAFGFYPIAAGGPVVAGNGFKPANYLVSYQPGTMAVSGISTPLVQQVQSEVITFLRLYTQEVLMQSPPAFDQDGKPTGSPDVVNADPNVCRPV